MACVLNHGTETPVKSPLIVFLSQVEICNRDDGTDWLLGEGTNGRVFKAVRGGIHDMAVKVLHKAGTDHLAKMKKGKTTPEHFTRSIFMLKTLDLSRL